MHLVRKLAALATATSVLTLSACTDLKRFAYEGFGRDDWQQPARVVETLAIAPGSRVADIGAGGGYFTFRLADAVGPDGTVYAIDVDSGMLDYISKRAKKEGRQNVEPVLATADDPGLPEGGVDLIFTSNTYHHLPDRPAYFARLAQGVRDGGRIAIVEYAPKGWFTKLFGHSTPEETIRTEMEQAGYRLVADHDFLDRQSFLVFTPSR